MGMDPRPLPGITGAVSSVNGHTGTVVLAASDVSADASGAAAAAQTAAEAYTDTAAAGKGNVVVHGSTAGTARPAGAAFVHWIGSVAPTNATGNDEWTDTANKALKRWNGSAFDALSGASVPIGFLLGATGDYSVWPPDVTTWSAQSGQTQPDWITIDESGSVSLAPGMYQLTIDVEIGFATPPTTGSVEFHAQVTDRMLFDYVLSAAEIAAVGSDGDIVRVGFPSIVQPTDGGTALEFSTAGSGTLDQAVTLDWAGIAIVRLAEG